MEMDAPVIVVGAGAAGLASAACLKRDGVPSLVLEAGDDVATTWRSLYDRLRLHTVRQLSGLPGYAMGRAYGKYAPRDQVVAYLRDYVRINGLSIRTSHPVTAARRDGSRWIVTTPQGELAAQALVSATGIFSNPDVVSYPGQADFAGEVTNASAYKNPAAFAGKRVLIVGSGNTGAEIAVDLADAGVATTISIRAGANVVPRDLLGVPIQRWAHVISALPRVVTKPLSSVMLASSTRRQVRAGLPRPTQSILDRPGVPIIGLRLLDLTRAGVVKVRPGIDRFTPAGVRFADGREEPFDTVLYATGYRPALDWLGDLITRDAGGFPSHDGVRSTDQPNLYFVGMNYNIQGTLFNIAHEAPEAARLIKASLAR
ncbi:MAG TPA: NAD(P)/FAD-dependent oxidoreductase [Ktedonobacterales bacterium]